MLNEDQLITHQLIQKPSPRDEFQINPYAAKCCQHEQPRDIRLHRWEAYGRYNATKGRSKMFRKGMLKLVQRPKSMCEVCMTGAPLLHVLGRIFRKRQGRAKRVYPQLMNQPWYRHRSLSDQHKLKGTPSHNR